MIRQKSLPSDPLACEIWIRESVPCPELTRCINVTKNIIGLTPLLAASGENRKGDAVQAALWFTQGKAEPRWQGEEIPASDALLNWRSLMTTPKKKPPKTPNIIYLPDFSSFIPIREVLCTKSGRALPPLVPSDPAGGGIKFEWRNSDFILSIKSAEQPSQDKVFKRMATFSSPFTPETVHVSYTEQTQPFLVCFEINCHPRLNILHGATFPWGPRCCYYPDRRSHLPNYTYSDLAHTETPLRQCFIWEVLHIHTCIHTHKIMSAI